MTSRWTVIEKAVKNISTVHPGFLLKDNTRQGFDLFLDKLKEQKTELLNDYVNYVATTFPIGDDTECGICVRYSHRVAWLALTRLIDALEILPESPTVMDVHSYFSRLFIPESSIYHHSVIRVVADVMHQLFNYSAMLHLKELPPSTSTAVCGLIPAQSVVLTEENTRPETAPIFATFAEINEILTYAAVIDSYPVVPEDIAGTLISTAQQSKSVDLSVLTPGVDSRIYVDRPRDPRICISCKVDSINIGLTDVEEQHTKYLCRCVFDTGTYRTGRFYDKAYVCRGATIVRLLLFNKSVIDKGLGCSCSDHNDVFRERLRILKLALDAAKLNQ